MRPIRLAMANVIRPRDSVHQSNERPRLADVEADGTELIAQIGEVNRTNICVVHPEQLQDRFRLQAARERMRESPRDHLINADLQQIGGDESAQLHKRSFVLLGGS